jgi:hypothetical protein
MRRQRDNTARLLEPSAARSDMDHSERLPYVAATTRSIFLGRTA